MKQLFRLVLALFVAVPFFGSFIGTSYAEHPTASSEHPAASSEHPVAETEEVAGEEVAGTEEDADTKKVKAAKKTSGSEHPSSGHSEHPTS